jgi:hypothetical protein
MGARVKGAVWCDKSPGSDCNRRGVNKCAIVVDKNSFPESMRESIQMDLWSKSPGGVSLTLRCSHNHT